MTPEARFASKWTPGPNGCWIWTAATNGRNYGVFQFGGRQSYAHRAAYEMFVGPIPAGFDIDHLCRVRLCVNPIHLEPVTPAENHRREMAARTHCPRGHAYDEANTYVRNGARFCRACNRISGLRRYRLSAQRRRDAASGLRSVPTGDSAA